ncbi:hypothetical protein DSO57_1038760 [Entomophthora muscae]|uniref:Uncharacterized protein n=1 Tax=Entomophthora muscae TaxID=34485 RepID=A0ACC2RPH2_9FUNG|nr:hypothetical protein DSO57_1038760 [Entomophthora muscae]
MMIKHPYKKAILTNLLKKLVSRRSFKKGSRPVFLLYPTSNWKNGVNRQIRFEAYANEALIRSRTNTVHGLPGFVTLFPIIVLLAISLISNQALAALFVGLFLSSTFINGFNPAVGFLRAIDYYIIQSLSLSEHSKVVMFTFYLSGMIAMIQKSGGAQALAAVVTKFATNRAKGQWATFVVGILIFLDDTASVMIVGSNFQPVTDVLYLSREKLAFLVHATSSPVSSLFPVSSWIGFQVGLIQQQLKEQNVTKNAFNVFLETLTSRFYPLFMLVFAMYTMGFGREFGPMLKAERRSFIERKVVDGDFAGLTPDLDPLEPNPNTPRRWFNAAVPITITIVMTLVSLMLSGYYGLRALEEEGEPQDYTLVTLAGQGDPFDSLLYASFLGCLCCLLMYCVQGIFTLGEALEILILGVKDVVESLIILILAWAIGDAFADLKCARFLVSVLSGTLPGQLVPAIAFGLACIISFTTGTSWGTTSIMFPLVIPLIVKVSPDNHQLLVYTVSSILAGALFGDQCSPISSSTILCCLASKVPVQAHVNTQLPYGILIVAVSIVFGYLPIGYGLYPDWAGLLIGFGVLLGVTLFLGQPTEFSPDQEMPISPFQRVLALFGRKPQDASSTTSEQTWDNNKPSPTSRASLSNSASNQQIP